MKRALIVLFVVTAVTGSVLTVVNAVHPAALVGDSAAGGAVAGDAHGLQLPLEHNALASRADTVIVGTVVESHVERFTDNEAIPDSSRSEPGYALSTFRSTTLAVGSVLAGEAPKNLSLATLEQLRFSDSEIGSTGDKHAPLQVGAKYVLFLDEGAALWTGHWISLGPQGTGLVTNDSVLFADGRSASLSELRQSIAEPVRPGEERYTPTVGE